MHSNKTLIGGIPDTGSESLAPFQYPKFWEMSEDMHKNHWRAQEIGSGKDIEDYRYHLSPAEKELFENQFSALTFMDVNILRPLSWLLAISTAPEVSTWIAVQIFQEENHEVAYQYCAEQTGLDEEALYTRHLTLPALTTKAELARSYTAKIKAFAQEKTRRVEELLEGVFFYSQVYEGMWFMGGFAPLFALCEQKKMINTGTQLTYIWRDEVLHVEGWAQWLTLLQKESGVILTPTRMHEIVNEGVLAEALYAQECLPTILGYSPRLHTAYMKHLANMRLSGLGAGTIYHPNEVNYPAWISRYQMMKETNFFEGRVTEYQTGGVLSWDD